MISTLVAITSLNLVLTLIQDWGVVAKTWPITGATFVLIHKAQDKPEQGSAVLKFFDWAFANGDKPAADLDYVSLPDALKAQIRKQFADVKDTAGKSVALK